MYTAQITIYTVLAMKSSQKLNPSKYDILNWINYILPKHLRRISSIEQMGTGVPYLYALSIWRPASVRMDRIVNQPQNQYEITCNLKYLASIFQKLQLSYSFEIDKVAQMKYQDNFHLASFLYKMQNDQVPSNSQVTQNLVKAVEPTKKVKIVLPRSPINIALKKIQTAPITLNTITALKPQPGPVFECICEEKPIVEEVKSQKLTKIAKLLNLERKEEKVYSEKTKAQTLPTLQSSQPPKPTCISESFKRFLRPSICERSKYIKQFVDENAPRQNFQIEIGCQNQIGCIDTVEQQNQNQRYQQLLSQKKSQRKQGQKNRDQTATEDNRQQSSYITQRQEQQLMYGL